MKEKSRFEYLPIYLNSILGRKVFSSQGDQQDERVLRFEADRTEGETEASVGRDRRKTKVIHSN